MPDSRSESAYNLLVEGAACSRQSARVDEIDLLDTEVMSNNRDGLDGGQHISLIVRRYVCTAHCW